MAKLLFFSDLHANVKLFNHLNHKGYPARASEILNSLLWVNDIVEEEDVSRVFFGGDLFNSVFNLKFPFFNLVFKGIYNIKKPTDLLDGNHDKYDSIYKVLTPFKAFANVHYKPGAYYDNILERRLVFLPFCRDLIEYDDGTTSPKAEEILEELLEPKQQTIVFMHQGIKGYFIDKFAVNPKIFDQPHIERVFAGHYHTRITKKIGGIEDKIVYPGSLISLNFVDNLVPRFCVTYDLDTQELKWHENPYAAYFISMMQNKISALKEKLEEIAHLSYLRIVLKEGEMLSLPMSFLTKFRGYISIKEKDIGKSKQMSVLGDENREFDYEAFANILADGNDDKMSLDLSYANFKNLVLSATATRKITQVDKETMNELLSEAYFYGLNN